MQVKLRVFSYYELMSSVSSVVWELYRMDCCNLANVILDHHIAPRISGNRRLFNLLLVVEFDLPWNSTQVDDYGASFQAWNSEEFTKAWNAVRRALPHNQLACVVLCFSLFFFAFG